MAGQQVFTYLNVAKESTKGTPVAPTRQLYAEGSGMFAPDFGLNFHEGENSGRRLRTRRATSQSEDVAWSMRTVSGVGYDDLVIPFSFLKGGVTGTGASADKTWTFTPSWTGANTPDAYTIDVGDNEQNWRLQYCQATSFKLTAAMGDVTQLEMSGFGQRAVKTAKATPSSNTAVKIPGDIWTLKQASSIAGLGAASVITNMLLGWELEVSTGLVWRHYQDGNAYGSTSLESSISANLTLTVESSAAAVTEFYDKAVAATMSFLRLKATGPTLGSSNYSAQLDMPVLYEVPELLAGDQDGINIYTITAHVADDGTNGLIPVIVNSLSALP